MIEIKPEHMKKGGIYYIQNPLDNDDNNGNIKYKFTGSGRQKGIFTGIFTEYWVNFTNIDNFNKSYSGFPVGDGYRHTLYCKFYLPQAQIIIDRKNHELFCLVMEKFINEQTNTRIGSDIVNVFERTENNNSYFVSNETKKQIHELKRIDEMLLPIKMFMKELKLILPMYLKE